jgi:hypothetical protein
MTTRYPRIVSVLESCPFQNAAHRPLGRIVCRVARNGDKTGPPRMPVLPMIAARPHRGPAVLLDGSHHIPDFHRPLPLVRDSRAHGNQIACVDQAALDGEIPAPPDSPSCRGRRYAGCAACSRALPTGGTWACRRTHRLRRERRRLRLLLGAHGEARSPSHGPRGAGRVGAALCASAPGWGSRVWAARGAAGAPPPEGPGAAGAPGERVQPGGTFELKQSR